MNYFRCNQTLLPPYWEKPIWYLYHEARNDFKSYFSGNLYASVDVRYADTKDIVTCATGRVMLVEIAMNLIAVHLVSSELIMRYNSLECASIAKVFQVGCHRRGKL